MKEVLEDWIRKAEADFNSACREIKVEEKENFDLVCILCQQCVEKYLKAFQIFASGEFQWGHNLMVLLEKCIAIDTSFEFIRYECQELNGMLRLRYPADFAVKEEAQLAMRYVKTVRKFIRKKLGLAKRRTKKRR